MGHEFRWIEWNVEKVLKHGCAVYEVEDVVDHPTQGQRKISGKYLVQGRGQGGRLIEVAYVIDPDGTIFVIHAMPLTLRRRRGGNRRR